MSAGGKRPSGQKGTLPLGTAVDMRETISETPFTEESGQESLLPLPDPVSGDALLPTPTATQNDGHSPEKFQERREREKAKGRNGNGFGLTLGMATQLLPTPVANEENPGAGGELRAAVVHGEGRRNETGTDTLGRPNTGRPSKLLPTPTAEDGERGRHGAGSDRLGAATFEGQLLPTPTAADGDRTSEQGPRHYIEGSDNPTLLGAARRATGEAEPRLLPTPRVTSERSGRKAMVENEQWSGPGLAQALELGRGELPREFESWDEVPGSLGKAARPEESLLPTPTAGDVREPTDDPPAGPPVLKDAATGIAWGVYEPAIRRWERILGREAPVPTDEKGRLAPAFVEWMLGYPAGWISDIDIPRTAQLRILGNSVQVDCGERVGEWLGQLAFTGII